MLGWLFKPKKQTALPLQNQEVFQEPIICSPMGERIKRPEKSCYWSHDWSTWFWESKSQLRQMRICFTCKRAERRFIG